MGILTKEAKKVPNDALRGEISNDLRRWRGPSIHAEWDRLTDEEAADIAALRMKCVSRGDETKKPSGNVVRGILTSQLNKRERARFEKLVTRLCALPEDTFREERETDERIAAETIQRELERRAANTTPPRPLLAAPGSVQFAPSLWNQLMEVVDGRRNDPGERGVALPVQHAGLLLLIAAAFENGGSEHQVEGLTVEDEGERLRLSKKRPYWIGRCAGAETDTAMRWPAMINDLSANGWVRIIQESGEGFLLERGPRLRQGIGA
jgi:hypothetical protein